MTRPFTLAVERIADEPRFSERFRRDPDRALRRYRLDHDQVEAIKAGDPASLARHGLDVVAFQDGKRHGIRPHVRKLIAGVAIVGASLGLFAAPASADGDFCKIRCARRIGVRRASIRAGRHGIRLGRIMVDTSSIRKGLRRNGYRLGRAAGRTALLGALRQFCGGSLDECVSGGKGDGPLVLAAAD